MERAGRLLAEGADILEVGGESTGPASKDVSAAEEMRRVVPVAEALHRKFPDATISVDTWKAAVAEAALAAGASMINDVTAGRGDARMFSVVARTEVRVVLMYAKDPTPRTTVEAQEYDDVAATIKTFLRGRRDAAVAAGIDASRIILDPGLGHFVSSLPRYSFQIIARLREFADLGCPLLLSPSRKSFLAGKDNLPVRDRLPETIAASAIAVLNGASFIRTHDVLEVRRGIEVAENIRLS